MSETTLFIANVLLQSTLILIVGLLVSRLWIRRPALRHSVLLLALIGTLASPLTTWAMMRSGLVMWPVPIAVAEQPIEQRPSAPGGSSQQRLLTESMPNDAPAVSLAQNVEGPHITNSAEHRSFRHDERARSERGISGTIDVVWRRLSPVHLLAGIWGTGVVMLSLGVLRSVRRLRRLRRHVRPVSSSNLNGLDRELSESLDTPLFPPVVTSDDVSTPLATGLRQPLIVLPRHLVNSLNPQELRDVLIHEAAHILRYDDIVLVMQLLLRTLFWPHPLVHWLNRELAAAREDVCDNFVLLQSERLSYSETLLRLAEWSRSEPRPAAAVGLFPLSGSLERRVAGLLHPDRETAPRLSRSVAASLCAGGLAFVGLIATSQLTQAPAAVTSNLKSGEIVGDDPQSVTSPNSAVSAAAESTVAMQGTPDSVLSDQPPPLRYRWAVGEEVVYAVDIEANDAPFSHHSQGVITCTPRESASGAMTLEVNTWMPTLEKFVDGPTTREALARSRIEPHLYPGCEPQSFEVTLPADGRSLSTTGSAQLPFLLGSFVELLLPPLPDFSSSEWSVDRPITLLELRPKRPGKRLWLSSPRDVEPRMLPLIAQENLGLTDSADDRITLERTVGIVSPEQSPTGPRFEIHASGSIVLAADTVIPVSVDWRHHLTERDGPREFETQVTIRYQRLDVDGG